MIRLVIHTHRFGVTVVRCNFKDQTKDNFCRSEEDAFKIAKLCGLDLDPERGESMFISPAPKGKTVLITKDMLK